MNLTTIWENNRDRLYFVFLFFVIRVVNEMSTILSLIVRKNDTMILNLIVFMNFDFCERSISFRIFFLWTIVFIFRTKRKKFLTFDKWSMLWLKRLLIMRYNWLIFKESFKFKNATRMLKRSRYCSKISFLFLNFM